MADTANEDTAHLRLIRRWLAGEVVNNHVGISMSGGPFDGRIRIMQLDEAGSPPPRTRGRKAGEPWHVYVLAAAPDAPSSWVYVHQGVEPADGQT